MEMMAALARAKSIHKQLIAKKAEIGEAVGAISERKGNYTSGET
jgi:hypothetical protein